MRLLQGKPLYLAATVALFAMSTSAQTTALPDLSTATEEKSTPTATASNTASNTNSATRSAASSGTTEAADDNDATSSSRSAITTGRITGSGSSAASITAPSITVSITGDATATDGGALTGLPTLSGVYKIYPASVPPTQNAPYMQKSTLPEGTVFIAVGSILGFMALGVLLWRALVAWSLHRSVKRAAMHQNMTDSKALFRTPVAPFYKDYHDRDSTISLGGLGKSGKKNKGEKGGLPRPSTANGLASTSSLFWSPTAGAAASGTGGLNTAGNRASSYLPAGYYAAGASSPANGQSHISLGHGNNISMSNLGPGSAAGLARPRSVGQTPPDSPHLTSSRGHMASSSTLNLNSAYNGDQRAPSAYLEDLFDGENGPPVPGHQHNRTGSGGRL
ncbi:hypothetical protein GLAREA_05901 [Glarea lozoyensis ATCC 20868]|uniref:CSI2 protein n=1 Tax=Glarea lozoyensis (strain ATCC 20868 / MF5171) TaxID=1116229 RepID=S3D6Y4_GLAL2|nr:uncharacterized protein GLAREA_05901 [Glarea lozoyensis ATCC 20868]EPE32889.1 hypothetical protein GLAREA_05901 [Glarea lozoyensis ATCC 20868]